jgi:hypothetical protein
MRKHKYQHRAVAIGASLATLAMMSATSLMASATAGGTMTLQMDVPSCEASINNLNSGVHGEPSFDELTNSVWFSFDQASLDWSAGDAGWCEGVLAVEGAELSSDPNRTFLFVSYGLVDREELVDDVRVTIDEGSGGSIFLTIDAYVSINKAGTSVLTDLMFTVTPS